MATQFKTTAALDKLICMLIKDAGALTMQVGGLASEVDWTLAYPNKSNGNNLDITTGINGKTVTVKAGSIWHGGSVKTLVADVPIGDGQAIPLYPAQLRTRVWAVDAGGGVIQVQTTSNDTPPGGTMKQIGVVYTRTDGYVRQVATRPEMINQLGSVTPTVGLVGWEGSPLATPPADEATPNNLLLTGNFDMAGLNRVGEFALTTGYNVSCYLVTNPTYYVAYHSMDTQILAQDVYLSVQWSIRVGTPNY